MLRHDFIEMPSKSAEIGHSIHETAMLCCKWCMKTPSKAREDGCCPIRELEVVGTILLSDYNPEGVKHFDGRLCVTCDRPIMGHTLRKGYADYWCYPNQNQFSDGVEGCVFEVKGVQVPEEFGLKTDCSDAKWDV